MELEMVLEGKLHLLELKDGLYHVGRAPDSDIQIPVPSVSKKHAELRVEGDLLYVRDIGSMNGTDVDGQPVTTEEVLVPEHASVRFAGVPVWRKVEKRQTVDELTTDHELNSQISYSPTQGYSDEARARIVEMLASLFELIASEQDAHEVQEAACAFVSKWVRADRVVLLEDEGEATTLQIKAQKIQGADPNEKLRVSSSIVNRVLKHRESVLVANTMSDPNFSEQQSIMALDLRSAMAAPLFDNERVRGILYVDTANARIQYGAEDLQVLAATANAVAVKLRNLSLEKEMRTAARIQRAMLPARLDPPAGWELDAHQVMCRAVGGDLYHLLPRPDGTLLVVVGDVAGKGMPAALAMGACIVLVRALAEIGGDLLQVTQHLHHQLFESLAPEQFITVFMGELDATTGRMRYVNAGHEGPLLLRAGGELEVLPSTGMAVAMLPELPITAAEVELDPGDLLAIFSDGIPEATTDGDRFFEVDPVKELLAEHRAEPLADIRRHILEKVDEFLGGEHASDDSTLLLLRRQEG